jgi:broad specificity phosphatase PhoE
MFEGKTFDEIHQTWPDHAQNWRKRIPDWEPPEGGESLLQLRERVTRTVSDWRRAIPASRSPWWRTAACSTRCTASPPARK